VGLQADGASFRLMGGFLTAVTILAALGCGVVAGVFFAFSAFVMKALDRLSAPRAVAAMQEINVAAPTPAFMAVLFGTALACGALIPWSLFVWGEPSAVYLLVGGGLYLICAIGLTIVYHVPRNDALARVEPRGAEAEGRWSSYVAGWTAWNHLRFAGALAASVLLVMALVFST
jgi:uncharacterized membrane protein